MKAGHRAALGAVMLLAAALRLPGLDRESIWLDEALSVRLARLPWTEMIGATGADGHPPLYLGLLHFWMLAFGTSETAVRSLSALLGIAAVPLVFVLGRRLAGEVCGLVAAALLACSSYHVYYSQEGRNYALLVLTTLLATLAYLRFEEKPDRRRAVLYVAAATLLLYTHVYAFFVGLVHALHYLGRLWRDADDRPPRLKAGLAVAAAVVVLLVPWIFGPWAALLARQVDPGTTALRIARPGLSILGVSLLQFAGSWEVLAVLAPLAALGLYAAARQDGSAALLLGAWLVIPHALPFAVSQVGVPVYITRSTIVTLPALLLLAAWGAARLRPRVALLLTVLVVTVATWRHWTYVQFPTKEHWRGVVALVERLGQPGDVVAFDAGWGQLGYDHYARRGDMRRVALSGDVREPQGRAELHSALRDARRVWIVRFQRVSDPPGVVEGVGGWGAVAGSQRFVGIELYLFERGAGGLGSPP